MNYIVFESGSRAGLSTELFFVNYCAMMPGTAHMLYLSDMDTMFQHIESTHPRVRHIHDKEAFKLLEQPESVIFPADEMTRQVNDAGRRHAGRHQISRVEDVYYNKRETNRYLARQTAGCAIKVPLTFPTDNVCLRPNGRSAGSRGLQLLESTCVTQRIDIEREFVVDILRDDNHMEIFPREVTLKNGYDRFVKLLPRDDDFAGVIREFVLRAYPANEGMFSDIFHLQLAMTPQAEIYYIESSKRISGTSLVNLAAGMNPFCFINHAPQPAPMPVFTVGKWYRFEDFLLAL